MKDIAKVIEEIDRIISETHSIMHDYANDGDWQVYNEKSSYINGLERAKKIIKEHFDEKRKGDC